ncbi:MAG: hypothetical protein GXP63_04980 [DPANN group archaeon]|nr:hypothetical protein [DPANN group archaeon]
MLAIMSLLSLSDLPFVDAAAGKYCNSTTTPCQCGAICNGGNEVANGYNTIDSCQDGTSQSFEYVNDVTASVLNGSTFIVNTRVEIDAEVDCDPDLDEVSIAYNNGSGFRNIYDTTCTYPNKIHKKVNLTLDNVAGNHTVRAIITYGGTTGMTCGYDYDTIYSDTDDVTFQVITLADTTPPQVGGIVPAAGTTFSYSPGQAITLSASINDSSSMDTTYALVSFGAKSQKVVLSDPEVDGTYSGSFLNTSFIGNYSVQFHANDSEGNLNGSESSFFYINVSNNITMTSPVNGHAYGNTSVSVDFILPTGFIPETALFSVNNQTNVTTDARVNISNLRTDIQLPLFLTANASQNISQSFIPQENMSVLDVIIVLKKKTDASLDSSIDIHNDSNGQPGTLSMGTGVVNDSLLDNSSSTSVTIRLDSIVNLTDQTRYWITLRSNASSPEGLLWEANDDSTYAQGNASGNVSLDHLFAIFDAYHYRLSRSFSQGSNTIITYANDSNGVIVESSPIGFTIDTVPPGTDFFNVSSPVELGDQVTFLAGVTDASSSVSRVLAETMVDGTLTNITLTLSGGTYSASFTTTATGTFAVSLFLNDSLDNRLRETGYTFNVTDTTTPAAANLSYSPNTSDSLDPGTPIIVGVTFSDLGGMTSVILQYRNQTQDFWSNRSMENSSSRYTGNFTPATAGNWTFRTVGTDRTNLSTNTTNITVEVVLDRSWQVSSTLNSTGAVLNSNISIGNFTVKNTGDQNLTLMLSVSADTAIPVAFNDSPDTLVSGANKTIRAYAETPAFTGEFSIGILLNASRNDTPRHVQLNMTLVAYVSGPTLLAEITDYDPSVTIGDQRVRLASSIKNVGNDTAQDVNLSWNLPTGWTAKGNSTSAIGSILVGETKNEELLVTIGGSAGTKTISVVAWGNNSINDTDSRTVTVSEASGGGSSGGGTDGSGGGGSAGGGVVRETIVELKNMSMTISTDRTGDSIEIPRGGSANITLIIRNSGATNITAITIKDTGEGEEYLFGTALSQDRLGYLRPGISRNVTFLISVPSYVDEGKYQVTITAEGSSGKDKVSADKKVIIVVLLTDKSSITACILENRLAIERLRTQGMNVERIEKTLADARTSFSVQDYPAAGSRCASATGLVKLAKEVTAGLDAYRERAADAADNENEIIAEAYQLVRRAYDDGDFTLAKNRLDDLQALITIDKELAQPGTINRLFMLLKDHPFRSAASFLAVLFLLTAIFRWATIKQGTDRLQIYQKELEAIRGSIQNIQHQHYVTQTVSRRAYEQGMETYRKRVADINNRMMHIRLRRVKARHGRLTREDLQDEKKKILEMEKELQKMFYLHKLIPRADYEQGLSSFRKSLNEIDKKLLYEERKGYEKKKGHAEKKAERRTEKQQKSQERDAQRTREKKKTRKREKRRKASA